MRFLHTSDWHLGRTLHGQPLLDAQARFVEFLADVVRDQGIHAVLVAGDLYDRSVPNLDAVDLLDDALHRLADLGVPVVAISGNHDSATRVGFGARLLARSGIHLGTDVARVGEPVLLTDDHGSVAVYPIPYLEPELSWARLDASGPRHEAVVHAAMQRIRADARQRAPGTRTVVVAHAFVGNAGEVWTSASERDITVGGTSIVPAAAFDGADFVALGHLHGFQQPIPDRVAYSGAPLAYSFSEADSAKSVSLVDLAADGSVTLERITCPLDRPLASVRGTLESFLHDASWAGYEHHWLSVTLTDPQVPAEPMARLRERFRGVLELVVEARRPAGGGSYHDRLAGLGDQEIASRFVEDMWHRPPSAGEQALLHAAFEAPRLEAVV